ncbi:MAG TPA: hypothetical protein VLA67_05905 [Nitrospiraceae bacterium]|nr:hypothetical protein [Nitrospiraceae bacterium]
MNNLGRSPRSHHLEWGLLIMLCSLTAVGCARPVSDMTSFDQSQDQMVIAEYYEDQAIVLGEKAAALTESALRYELLFGPESDWVTGARQLSQYYAAAAQEQKRLAEAHAKTTRTGRQRR